VRWLFIEAAIHQNSNSSNAHRGGFSSNHTVHQIYALETVSRSSLAHLEPELKFKVDPTCGGKLFL
jgi:hypothetical protein